MEVLLIMLVVPSLGGGLLLSEWQSRGALGRELRSFWRFALCGLGALLVPVGLGMICLAVVRYLEFTVIQSLMLAGRLLLSSIVICAGVAAVRVGLFADELDLSLLELGRRNRLADGMRLTAWVLVGFPLLWPFCILLLVCSPLMYFAALWTTGRRGNQTRLMWLLAIAVENNMPLADEIDAFADSFWGGFRAKVFRLADHLRDGVALADALEVHPGLLPRSVVISVRTGEQTRGLGRVLRTCAAAQTRELQRTHLDGSLVAVTMYYWWILTTLSLVVGFICYWIIPKYKAIFDDFGVELPAPTVSLINTADTLVGNFWLIVPLIGLPLSLILLLTYIHLVGWGNLNWPWLLRWFPRRDAPEVLHNLAFAVAAEQSLPQTLETIGGRHYRRDLGERLQRIGAAVDAGDDGWQSLGYEGFVSRAEAEAVRASARAGHLAYALDALAGSMERVRRHRTLWWIEICKPLIVIVMGCLVAAFCLAMFLPLVKLINDLN
jgi:type IV pilus assembly protein PilC